ncbi:P63C domain-containing protein [Bifidobacterium panos]|uniref:Phage protein n=1 Tax=Bifidobacterium panos TaxID=2675321 RepID=A0ABX1SYC8_9BIFI|nr:P63C domain-containing protein [Bifidobacterium sp. DSM 109963]NMN02835.1 phage protein [Bifidobacterium sp. DSM 109963]
MNERKSGETAEYSGHLNIGDDIDIPCGVMGDGTRLLSERAVTRALGGKRGGSHWLRQKEGNRMPVYASAGNLQPFIHGGLAYKLVNHRLWRAKGQGGFGAYGIEAEALPEICEVYMRARHAGVLLPSQEHIAEQADILMAALAKVGIVALVDEATGYQSVRQRDELQKLLSKYIAEELQPWAKRFPDEFYTQLFRLRGWDYQTLGAGGKKPRLVGKLTNDIIYERMPRGVLDELKRKNPPDDSGRRRYKHHQFLTEDIGDDHLALQISNSIALMKASRSWGEFNRLLDRVYPKYGSQQGELDLED